MQINQARAEAKNAYSATQMAHRSAEMAKNESEIARNKTLKVMKDLEKFVNSSSNALSPIRSLAEEVSITLRPKIIISRVSSFSCTNFFSS